METKFFEIETRRISYHTQTGERASGEAASICYTRATPQKHRSPPAGGQIVYLENYLQRNSNPVDTRIETPRSQPPKRRRCRGLVRIGPALELLSAAGVLLLVAGVLIKLCAL